MTKSQGFTFKQFHVNHERCAMKVGTDGILLGAWADIAQAERILDLGTGTGLIALMLAQRSKVNAQIVGVEIDSQAAEQARENVENSPWTNRIQIEQQDIADFVQKCGEKLMHFDVIVANPPYFTPGIDCRTHERNRARYTSHLSHLDWLNMAEQCLSENGCIHFVLPLGEGEMLIKSTALYCMRRCNVITKRGKTVHRVLLTFSREGKNCENSELVIYNEQNQYTDEFKCRRSDLI